MFLELLVLNDLDVDIVGVLSGPLDESLICFGDCKEFDFALNASDRDNGVSLSHFVAKTQVLV